MSFKTICCSTLTPARNVILARAPRCSQPFSASSKVADAAKAGNHEDTQSKENPSKGEKKKKPGGSYTRVAAAFGLGIPLGLALKQFNDSRNGVHTADRGEFVKYILVDKEIISPTSSVFRMFPAADSVLDFSAPEWERAVASVQFKQPQLQIARWYTLLPRVEDQEEHELRFLIRKEQNGEVSGYLHRLPVGSDIELRGPEAEYVLPEKVDSVLFLAGGTGIAPAMQIADSLAGKAAVNILWANRRREDCVGGHSGLVAGPQKSIWNPASWFQSTAMASAEEEKLSTGSSQCVTVAQLEEIASRSPASNSGPRVQIAYFVDEEGSFIRPEQVSELVTRMSSSNLGRPGDSTGAKILIVSGPEGFVNYWAGPKSWYNGREMQGPLGGVLAQLQLDGWEVVKL